MTDESATVPDNEPTDDEQWCTDRECRGICAHRVREHADPRWRNLPLPVAHPDNRWNARELPPGGATALLDDGTVAAVIYLPWGLALGQRIAALLNAPTITPALPDPDTAAIAAWISERYPGAVSYPDIKAVLAARAALLGQADTGDTPGEA